MAIERVSSPKFDHQDMVNDESNPCLCSPINLILKIKEVSDRLLHAKIGDELWDRYHLPEPVQSLWEKKTQ